MLLIQISSASLKADRVLCRGPCFTNGRLRGRRVILLVVATLWSEARGASRTSSRWFFGETVVCCKSVLSWHDVYKALILYIMYKHGLVDGPYFVEGLSMP